MTLEELQADFAARLQEQHEKAALALEESARRSDEARAKHHAEMDRLKSALYGGKIDEYTRDFYDRVVSEKPTGDSQGVDGGEAPVGDAVNG